MTNIEYKPHCANCGALINEEVTYTEIISGSRNCKSLLSTSIEINPCRCNYCGKIFNGITIRKPRNTGIEEIL